MERPESFAVYIIR
jgi:hypothetical protein